MTQPVIRLTRRAERQRVESFAEAHADAKLAMGVALACVVTQAVLLVAPVGVDLGLPVGVDALWLLGSLLAVLLMPVVAALAAFTSVRAFLVHGRGLPAHTRQLHLVTLGLAALLFVWIGSGWSGPALAHWAD